MSNNAIIVKNFFCVTFKIGNQDWFLSHDRGATQSVGEIMTFNSRESAELEAGFYNSVQGVRLSKDSHDFKPAVFQVTVTRT